MKRIVKLAIVLVVLFVGLGYVFLVNGSIMHNNNSQSKEALPDVALSFSVLGDIHENPGKLKEVINDLYNIRPNMDAMVLNGDTVDQGLQEQYDSIKSVLSGNSKLIPKVIIKNIGNHEFFNYNIEYNQKSDVEEFLGRYYDFSGEKTVYHDTWVKGYHFISLGSESGNTKELGSMTALISENQMKWLNDKLSEGYEKGKPIFVFLHQPINSTKTGTAGIGQGAELKKMLFRYPEVIIFSSHTHASAESSNIVLDQPYTMVQTGAIHYTLTRDEKGERVNRHDLTYGIYVEVDGNKVTVKKRDFKDDTWVYSKEIDKSVTPNKTP